MPAWNLAAWDESESEIFSHVLRHIFPRHWPYNIQTLNKLYAKCIGMFS